MELTTITNIFPNPYVMKCILLGRHSSGKSTLANVLQVGVFDPAISPTIGMDFATILIKIGEQNIRLQIWDSAGQERFRDSIVATYVRDAHLAFIVFDITCRESWEDIINWKKLLDKQQYKVYPRLVLVGTKTDIPDHVVAIEEIQAKAKEWNCNYYVLSSKQTNSQNMIHRMFSLESELLHKKFLRLVVENKELPPGIFSQKKAIISEKISVCCHQ